ncbi:hypothetical protein [Fundidesulfovibrio putealis]|uniref:hypothetical protein n=1 Tax=Fundidesulfovibrio putealis TaxID=270496 RepID=UPI00040F4A82|nr:hypothetical protein [Fundidesulfovibrio putealis]
MMRRFPLASALALMATLLSCSLAFAQGGRPNDLSEMHAGFRGINWGQSISDIQGRGIQFGGFEASGSAINVPVQGGTAMNVNNIPVKMSFTFIDKKFGGIVIVPADESKAKDLTAFFIQQFGAPVFMDQVSQRNAWQDDKITIIMRETNKVITFIIMNNDIFKKANLPVEDYVAKGKPLTSPKPGGI